MQPIRAQSDTCHHMRCRYAYPSFTPTAGPGQAHSAMTRVMLHGKQFAVLEAILLALLTDEQCEARDARDGAGANPIHGLIVANTPGALQEAPPIPWLMEAPLTPWPIRPPPLAHVRPLPMCAPCPFLPMNSCPPFHQPSLLPWRQTTRRVFSKSPELMLQSHGKGPFTGENTMHIVIVNRHEKLLLRMIELALERFTPKQAQELFLTQVCVNPCGSHLRTRPRRACATPPRAAPPRRPLASPLPGQ